MKEANSKNILIAFEDTHLPTSVDAEVDDPPTSGDAEADDLPTSGDAEADDPPTSGEAEADDLPTSLVKLRLMTHPPLW